MAAGSCPPLCRKDRYREGLTREGRPREGLGKMSQGRLEGLFGKLNARVALKYSIVFRGRSVVTAENKLNGGPRQGQGARMGKHEKICRGEREALGPSRSHVVCDFMSRSLSTTNILSLI